MHRIFPAALTLTCLVLAPLRYGQNTGQAAEKEVKPARTPDVVFVPTPQDVVEKMFGLEQKESA